ncbi:unnamed protein product [Ectocarpus sp. 12 AP-2014]
MFQETNAGSPPVGYDGSVDPVSKEVVEAQQNRIVQMLLQGKTYGLPGSDGKMWSNFREWAKNQHPVLSMCFAHELHPFSRTERLSVLLCYLCWAFLITCVFEQQMNHDNQEICDGGCENTNTHHSTLEEMCGSGSSDNSQKVVSVEDYSNACDDIMPWYVLSFTIAACTVPYSTVLKVLATCGCVQQLPHFIKRCFEFIGTIMLSVFGCLSLVWLGVGISISLTLDGGMFLVTYLTGVVKSWFYWPMIAGVVFVWKYKRAKRRFEEEHPGQVAMAWPIDQQDIVKIDDGGKPVAYQSPPGSPRSGDGEESRKAGAHHAYRGTGTPEPTPSPRPVTFNGGYARPPRYEPEDGLYMSPPSPSDGYPTAPPRLPAVNPYCNQQDACTGSPHHEQQQIGTFQGYIGMAEVLSTPPPGSPVGLHGSPEHGMEGGVEVALVLPPGWEAKVLPEGRIMYIDHNTQTTHWEPPAILRVPPSPPSYHQHQAIRGQQQVPPSPPSYNQHQAMHGQQQHQGHSHQV